MAWIVLQFSLASFFPPFFSEFRRVGLAIGSSRLVCTLLSWQERNSAASFPLHPWTSVRVQRFWSNRNLGWFFILWLWTWAAGVTAVYELRGFSVGSWLFSSSLVRFIRWGTVERLWNWKEALANNKEGEGPASRGCARFVSCSALLLKSRLWVVGEGERLLCVC